MNKTHSENTPNIDDLMPEYHFDYQKAKPNRFANKGERSLKVVVLDEDVAQVFTTPESVNQALRALIETSSS
jgi:hypothetical protein